MNLDAIDDGTGEIPSGHLTRKAMQILETIAKGDGAGDFIDLDQLLERLPYRTSKESMQFSIRALIRRRLVEKREREIRRGRRRVVYALTLSGRQKLPLPVPQGIEIEI